MTQLECERTLAYDRIDANRRAVRRLLVLFAIAFVPAGLYLAQYLLMWVVLVISIVLVSVGLVDLLAPENWPLSVTLMVGVTVAVCILIAWLQYRFAAAIILRFSGARPIADNEEPHLRDTLANLCIGAGLPQPRLYIIESATPNAFAVGMDPERASLVVTRGLLSLLQRRELEGALAHELVQIANLDTRLGTVLAAGVALLRLPFAIVASIVRFLFRIHWLLGLGPVLYFAVMIIGTIPFGISAGAEFFEENPLTGIIFYSAMVLPIYVFVVAPIIAELLRAAVLRRRQFLADADALLLTRHPDGLATALVKMSAVGQHGLKAGAATAHLYIVDPLPAERPWWDKVLSSHPPLDERVELLSGMAGGIPASVLETAERDAENFRAPSPTASELPVIAGDSDSLDNVTLKLTDQPPLAYRLISPSTVVYEQPDSSSKKLFDLPTGSLITVSDSVGDFLHVITPRDCFGYIRKAANMTPADMPS